MEPEPQKNGKTINWCTVDVGDAQRHRRAAGHRLRRPQLRRRRPRRRRAARRRAARRLRDLRAQDLRPRLGRDDLLGPRARPRRGPRRHHRAARRRRRARRRRASRVLGLDEEVIEFEINPDRAYALSLRGVAREAALGFGAAFHRPGAARRSRPPTATATRSASRTRRAARSSWPAPSPASTRPRRRPDWLAQPRARWPGCGRSRWPSTSPTT